jgi:hypothetical protein
MKKGDKIVSEINDQIIALDKLSRDIKNAAATMTPREARYLVDLYYQMQDNRIRAAGQIRAMTQAEQVEPHATLDWVMSQGQTLETSIRTALGAFAKARVVGAWSQSICGIGPVISAGLIAHIDGENSNTVSRIWRYAGLDPTVKWEKGQKRPWNASLKVLCWKIGQSFVKVSNNEKDFYGKLYQQRKAYEAERNERGDNKEAAARTLAEKRIGQETDAYKALIEGKLPKAQIQQRAERWAVKIFLSHWHQVCYYAAHKKLPPKPYVLAILGHGDEIQVPNWPF